MTITEDQFRKTLGLFPTGVTVVTAPQHSKDIGITVSSFTSVSLDPPQILFCLAKRSKTILIFRDSPYFAVNILSAHQAHVSDGFARHVPLKWEGIKTHRHPETRCLLISEALGHVVCEKAAIYEGGDHDIILGKVIDLTVSSFDQPLVRHRGKYSTSQPIPIMDSGHLSHGKS